MDVEVQRTGLDIPPVLIRFTPVETADFDPEAIDNNAGRKHSKRNVRGIEPVVADRRFRQIHDRFAMHEGRWAERRFARKTAVEEDAALRPDVLGQGCRQFHEEVMRMLPINEVLDAVGRLAARQQKRISPLAHQRIGTEHGAELDRAVTHGMTCHAHQHAGKEGLLIAPPARLKVVDQVEHAMAHEGPPPPLAHQSRVLGSIRLPSCAGGLPGHWIGAKRSDHRPVTAMPAFHPRTLADGGRVHGGVIHRRVVDGHLGCVTGRFRRRRHLPMIHLRMVH